ncbi:unnamed protein product [Symbiodinium sp. CCMP2592]|nr:unnamed protein product [Symbiodinium sp. CCMP2592]
MKSSRREATGKCLIPAGHSRRALALLRRKRCLRPHNRQLQRCEMRPPRKLLQAGAASSDKGIAGAAALNGVGAEKGPKGPPQGSYLWYCRPCWDDWLVRYKQWFAAEDDEEWLANAESSEVSTSSSSFGGSKASRPRSLTSTGEDLLHFDFIEVGTCNYHTFTQFVGGHPDGKPSAYRYLPYSDDPRQLRGLAVDMKSRYLDQLPDLPNVQKVRAALTEHEEVLQMYHVRVKDIEHWERVFATQGAPDSLIDNSPGHSGQSEAEGPATDVAPPPPPFDSWGRAFNGVMAGQRRRRGTGAPLETVLGTIRCAVFGCNCDD